jgi:predicted alpha/beta-fold hydrolase
MSRSASTPQASASVEIPADPPGGGWALPAYRAPIWLPGGHLQTIGSALIGRHGSLPTPVYQRERWTTPDLDFVDVDWLRQPISQTGNRPVVPLVVLFHGLEGSSQSHYASSFAAYAQQRGWNYVVPHFRGCSGEINLAPRAYHSGDHVEIDWILRRIRKQHDGPIVTVGISLGGNALLRWGQEAGQTAANLVNCLAAVCAPIDLAAGGCALGHGLNRHIYTPMFLRSMKPKALLKLRQHPGLFDRKALESARTLYAFDNVFTAPLHGFKNTEDYWARASAKPHLHALRLPTLILHARNDPFVPAWSLPTETDASRHVTLWQTIQGGHVGFAQGLPPGHVDYLPQQVGAWLGQHLNS